MFKYIPVWSSTIDHVDRCMDIIRSRKDIRKSDVPKVKMFVIHKPLPFLASGVLTLEDERLTYAAVKPQDTTLLEYYNLDPKLTYAIPYNSIIRLDRYLYEGIDWIRLKYIDGQERKELLLVYGAFGFSGASAAVRTNEIYKLLKKYTSS